MNRKQTWWLVGTALAFFAFIYFFERHQPGMEERQLPPRLLAGMSAQDVRLLEVTFSGTGTTVRAEKTNDVWTLTEPMYPAQRTALENLAATLTGLRKLETVAPHEVLIQGAKSFGFDPPAMTLRVEGLTNSVRVHVGGPTPINTNVYVKLDDQEHVFVVDGRLKSALPAHPTEWRSSTLIPLSDLDFDRLEIRSGQRVVEIERNPTNHIWHLSKPIPARADPNQIELLLQQLRSAQVKSFVPEASPAQLEQYGLASPDLQLALSRGTNRLFTLEFGTSPTNQAAQVYARRGITTNVVTVDRRLAEVLNQPYKSFHAPQLLSFSAGGLDRITVQSIETFALQRQKDRSWMIHAATTNRADKALVGYFVTNLMDLEIIDLVREVPTEADMKTFQLSNPVAVYSIFEKTTNAAGLGIQFTELSFGATNSPDTISARRSDEAPIYVTRLAQVLGLPRRAFELRDRTIWTFSPTNVISMNVSTQGLSKLLIRDPATGWFPDPIRNAAVEEIVYRLGHLEALGWVAKGADRLAPFGFRDTGLTLSLSVAGEGTENPEIRTIRFGNYTPRGNVYASVVLPGDTEPVIFEFPGTYFYELVRALPLQ